MYISKREKTLKAIIEREGQLSEAVAKDKVEVEAIKSASEFNVYRSILASAL